MPSIFKHCWSQLFSISAPAIRANILTSAQDFFVSKQPIKKSNQFENPMSPESYDSRAKAPSAKRSEKGCGDENECPSQRGPIAHCVLYICLIICFAELLHLQVSIFSLGAGDI